jgi:hypothetical protein
MGIDVRTTVKGIRKNGRQLTRLAWQQARELNPRKRELFEPTEFTRPVDFHSFRRAFKQALADAGVELTAQMALSGATDARTHQRYLNNTARMRIVPDGALPQLAIGRATTASHNDDSHGHLESQPVNDCDENSVKTASTGTDDLIPKLGVASSNPVSRSGKQRAEGHPIGASDCGAFLLFTIVSLVWLVVAFRLPKAGKRSY